MAEYTKQDIFDIITEYLEQYGSAIGTGAVRLLTQEELNDPTLEALLIPSMMPSTEEWVQTSLSNMMRPITTATSDLTTLKQQTAAAAAAANDAAGSVETAVTAAGNVNATLYGMTVTVTDRQGVSTSVNIGFEIFRTYTSKALMRADAANVPEGRFVMIGTTDHTDPDNATLWARNSLAANVADPQFPFDFLSDLDQASTAAWADWLDNMKPSIEAAITTAGNDHTQALSDHKTATQDHSTASTDHQTATSDHQASATATALANEKALLANQKAKYANTEGGYAEELNSHPPFIGDGTTGDLNYWYLYNTNTHAYVRAAYAKGNDLDYSTMTAEERQRLIDDIKADLVFASVQTCEDIIDELI